MDYGPADRSTPATRFRVAGVAGDDADSGRRLWYADLDKAANDGKLHLVSDVTITPDTPPCSCARTCRPGSWTSRAAGAGPPPRTGRRGPALHRSQDHHRGHPGAVTVTDTVADPVSSAVTAGPRGTTYALGGVLAALLAGRPNDGFTPVFQGRCYF
ncbi:hypothetical protein [Streptomyces mirabilis]|uniref:hypothetical protein n=1 Tax=Streptomyces mirabilis TaxID=68239 RepID=UPI0036AAA22D